MKDIKKAIHIKMYEDDNRTDYPYIFPKEIHEQCFYCEEDLERYASQRIFDLFMDEVLKETRSYSHSIELYMDKFDINTIPVLKALIYLNFSIVLNQYNDKLKEYIKSDFR